MPLDLESRCKIAVLSIHLGKKMIGNDIIMLQTMARAEPLDSVESG